MLTLSLSRITTKIVCYSLIWASTVDRRTHRPIQINSSERLPTYVYGNIAFLLSTTFLSTGAKVPQERKLKGTKLVCGANVPRVRKFHGTKVLRLFAPRGQMFHGTKVTWELLSVLTSNRQTSSWSITKVLSVDFSLPRTKVQRNEKAR